MTAHQGFRVAATTAGSPAPSGFEHLRVNYVYRGNKPLAEEEPPKGGAFVRSAERERRIEEFAKARTEEGLTVAEAAERVGVKTATGYEYETERRARKTGGPEAGNG